MSESNLPGCVRLGDEDVTPEPDEFAVRVVIETTDAGPDRAEAVRWVSEWVEAALRAAPFSVDGLYAYTIGNIEIIEGAHDA